MRYKAVNGNLVNEAVKNRIFRRKIDPEIFPFSFEDDDEYERDDDSPSPQIDFDGLS